MYMILILFVAAEWKLIINNINDFFLNEWVFRTSFCSLGQILIQFLSQPKMRISDKRHSLFIHILLEHNLFFFCLKINALCLLSICRGIKIYEI